MLQLIYWVSLIWRKFIRGGTAAMPNQHHKTIGFCIMGLSIIAALFSVMSADWYPKYAMVPQISYTEIEIFSCNFPNARSNIYGTHPSESFFCPAIRDLLPSQGNNTSSYKLKVGLRYVLLLFALTFFYGLGIFKTMWHLPFSSEKK